MIYIFLFFLIPLLLLKLASQISLIKNIGVVTFCYIIGIIIGNIPGVILPEEMMMKMIEVIVPLSIPMLLFQSDWNIWKTKGGNMLKSFFLGVLSVVVACSIAFWLFKNQMAEAKEFSAMMSGIYTGGTMNMSSIGLSLNVSNESFILLNMAEMLMGGAWLLFLLAFSKRFFSMFLIPAVQENSSDEEKIFDEHLFWPGSLWALLLSIGIFALSIALSFLIAGKITELIVILGITSFGILASAHQKVKNWKGSFGMGNYLLYVFCMAIGSLANIEKMIDSSSTTILFVASIFGITISLHFILSRIFKIDVDTFIISSTAGLYGPPFIGPVAKGIKNPSIIPLGIAISIIGLAIGNYCGIALFRVLDFF